MNRIREFRTLKHMTLAQLAAELGYDTRTVQRFETGERNVSLKQLERIAKVLDVSAADLIDKNTATFSDNDATKMGVSEHRYLSSIEKDVYQSALIREVCSSPPAEIEAKIAKALNQYNEEFKKNTGADPTADSVRSYLISIKPLFMN